jgi:phage gp16-like protein
LKMCLHGILKNVFMWRKKTINDDFFYSIYVLILKIKENLKKIF